MKKGLFTSCFIIRLLVISFILTFLPPAFSEVSFSQFEVSSTIQSVCSVSASDLSFGSYEGFPSVQAKNDIEVTCSLGSSYHVGLNGGSHGGTVSDRYMVQPTSSDKIHYNIYDEQHSEIWGDTNADDIVGTEVGSPQHFTGYGLIPAIIPPALPPSAGDYSDTITVTVTVDAT